jgi:hypothetical protein
MDPLLLGIIEKWPILLILSVGAVVWGILRLLEKPDGEGDR